MAAPVVQLVVRDSWLQAFLADVLSSEGYAVHVRPTRGRPSVARAAPDLIVADLELAPRNRIRLAGSHERKRVRLSPTILIGATPPGLPYGRGGVACVCDEPVDLEALLEQIAHVLAERRALTTLAMSSPPV